MNTRASAAQSSYITATLGKTLLFTRMFACDALAHKNRNALNHSYDDYLACGGSLNETIMRTSHTHIHTVVSLCWISAAEVQFPYIHYKHTHTHILNRLILCIHCRMKETETGIEKEKENKRDPLRCYPNVSLTHLAQSACIGTHDPNATFNIRIQCRLWKRIQTHIPYCGHPFASIHIEKPPQCR